MAEKRRQGRQWGNAIYLNPSGGGTNAAELANVRLTRPAVLLITADVSPGTLAAVEFAVKLGVVRGELISTVVALPAYVVAQSLVVTAKLLPGFAGPAPKTRVSLIVVPITYAEEVDDLNDSEDRGPDPALRNNPNTRAR
jgi:hypothetical protein